MAMFLAEAISFGMVFCMAASEKLLRKNRGI